MKTHKSKIGSWYIAIVLAVLLLPVPMGILVGGSAWLGFLICAACAGCMIWLYLATKYVIGEGRLTIHAGLYKISIPIREITSITESRNALASPAFSLDRLEIQYGSGKIILISPKDKAQFLRDLDWNAA